MRSILTVAAVTLMIARASVQASTPVIVMVGESTTWGLRADHTQSPTHVGAVLQYLLAQRPDCTYANVAVRNWALSATGTAQWFLERPDLWCILTPAGQNPLLDYACAHNVPLAAALIPVLTERGEELRALIVNAQGTNDAHILPFPDPLLVAQRIATWPSYVPPGIPVWIAPPFFRNDAPTAPIPLLLGVPPRLLRNFVRRLRRYELVLGILNGPDWQRLMPLPNYQADGFHFTDGTYANAAGWWLDILCPSMS